MIFIAVSEKMPNGQVFRKDLTHFIGEVELPGFIPFADDGHLLLFKVNAVEVKRMDLADPKAGLIHQGIDGIVTDTKQVAGRSSHLHILPAKWQQFYDFVLK